MNDFDSARERRLLSWHQTLETRIHTAEEGAQFIQQAGIVTLYPVSSEIPNLFQAFVGDPAAKTDSAWDSPSGEVYSWRWTIGRQKAGFYSALVRKRPTWISWSLLPAVLRISGELRSPADLYQAGELPAPAYRIAQALENEQRVLTTGELRKEAGFPTGKEQRAAYLKAVEALDSRLMLAKVFADGDEDMRHALVRRQYPEQVAEAEPLSYDDALDAVLQAYLPHAIYAIPTILAKDLAIPETRLREGLQRLAGRYQVVPVHIPGQKSECYLWQMQISTRPEE